MSQSLHMLPEGMREPHGLYHPRNEHDACGIGLIANINNIKSHRTIDDGLSILKNLEHRGAVGADRCFLSSGSLADLRAQLMAAIRDDFGVEPAGTE